jgi:16S rRNA (cytidine1402-2'-O)-methyltransferase
MASGMNGQNFAFIGYIPVKPNERAKKIKQLETRSQYEKQTQIFIETPYRNNQLLNDLVKYCDQSTQLCVACDLTGENEFIASKTIRAWKNSIPNLNKKPAIFMISRG